MPNLGNTNTLMDIPHKTIVQSKSAKFDNLCIIFSGADSQTREGETQTRGDS